LWRWERTCAEMGGNGIDSGFRWGWAVWEWVGMGMNHEIGAELCCGHGHGQNILVTGTQHTARGQPGLWSSWSSTFWINWPP